MVGATSVTAMGSRRLRPVGFAGAFVMVGTAAAARVPADLLAVPAEPPAVAFRVEDAFPAVAFWRPTSMESPRGDHRRLFVGEREGRIYLIPDVTAPVPSKVLFLDISERVLDDGNEQGLKGFALHPQFDENGFIYVSYVYWAGSKSHPDNANVRLSRFNLLAGRDDRADELSELVLIDQNNDGSSAFGDQSVGNGGIHNAAEVNFGPDGYLYLGLGDENLEGALAGQNVQRIDQELWSGIIRIDVDKREGNLEPNPHPTGGIPLGGDGLARFSVPADNPFVGATSFNGRPVTDPSAVRTEFFAVGFRNPWQFSFDPVTGELWVGDVGFWRREEINVVPPGANAGWDYFEGDLQLGPPPGGAALLAPEWSYLWGDAGEFQGRCVTGGIVYRGDRYPSLVGKYIFADFVTGHVWSLERSGTPGAPRVQRIAGHPSIVGLNLDPSNGDILFLDHSSGPGGTGKVRRLVYEPAPDDSFPTKLSETGLFESLEDLTPNPGVIAYEPNLPFWSDHAIKSRFFALRDVGDKLGFTPEGAWSIPPGAVFAKHFDIETVRGDPASSVRLETRLLVTTATGAFGVAYRWNEEGTDADLVPDGGASFPVEVTDGGVAETQVWQIPSRSQCLTCHTSQAGHVLSVNTRQLNREGEIGGEPGNLLALLASAGYLEGFDGLGAKFLPRHVAPDETTYSLESRVRSYLEVNCANCHQDGGTAPAAWDGRAALALADTHLLDGFRRGDTGDQLVVPGERDRSVVWNRITASNGYTRMPPLGSNVVDESNAALVAEWIEGELSPAAGDTFAEWWARFSAGDPARERDSDRDGATDYFEFLTRTDPLDPASRADPTIGVEGGAVHVWFPGVPDRPVSMESSTDGEHWEHWRVTGNDAIPRGEGGLDLVAPLLDHTLLFRVRVGSE